MSSPSRAALASLAQEYEALTHGVALLDRSRAGRLRFQGKDALDLLNRLSTNQLNDLASGEARATVLTSNKGRIVDVLTVARQDGHLLVLTSPETPRKVAEYIDFYTFSEDVRVEDITGATAMLSVTGPQAEAWAATHMVNPGTDVAVFRDDFLGAPGYAVVVPVARRDALWERLSRDTGATPAGEEAVEAVRVERGVPVYGRELGEEYNPLETGLRPIISFTKGCYVGQEVVARLDTYKKVQRRLAGLRWEADARVDAGADIVLDGEGVGVLTSAARLPDGAGVGLGYVKRGVAEGAGVSVDILGKLIQARLVEM